MRGLLADANLGGLQLPLRQLLESLDLWSVLAELRLELLTFEHMDDLRLDIDDRALWARCQNDGLILLTDNRNQDGPDSLEAVLRDTWRHGDLPVLTLANKLRFERDRGYASRVAQDVAELLFGVAQGEYRHSPRLWLPLNREIA